MNKIDVLSKINEGMRAVLAKEDELAGNANDTSAGFEQMRLNYTAGRAYWVEGGPEMAEKVDCKVEGPHGDIPVRLYYPVKDRASLASDGETLPAIVYAHGGGFVLGNLDTHDRICRVLASKTGAAVAAVDYRLSPEAKFPVAVEEVACVAKHLHEELGGSDYVKCLLLFYGWYGLKDSASQRLLGGPWDGLTEAEWQWYKELYAEDTAELETSPYANLFLNDLTRDMPSCYIAAAEYDPLKDDSTALATILEEYGIPHRFEMFEGVIHAFLHYTKMLDEANLALEHGAEHFRQQMGC